MSDKPRGRPRDPNSKRSKGGPQHAHRRVIMTFDGPLERAFDAYLETLEVKPVTSEIIRHAIREFLKAKGLWPPPPDPNDPKADSAE